MEIFDFSCTFTKKLYTLIYLKQLADSLLGTTCKNFSIHDPF